MGFSDTLNAWWYELRGRRARRVGLDEFSHVLHPLLSAMVPGPMIIHSAGVKLQGEWHRSYEEEVIEAHVAHLMEKFQPAHNSLQDIKLEPPYRRLHWALMQASRAYGETIATDIECRRLFLSPQYLTKPYYRKQRDGKQWDALAREKAEYFLGELDDLRIQMPAVFSLLGLTDANLEGIESIQAGVCQF